MLKLTSQHRAYFGTLLRPGDKPVHELSVSEAKRLAQAEIDRIDKMKAGLGDKVHGLLRTKLALQRAAAEAVLKEL